MISGLRGLVIGSWMLLGGGLCFWCFYCISVGVMGSTDFSYCIEIRKMVCFQCSKPLIWPYRID